MDGCKYVQVHAGGRGGERGGTDGAHVRAGPYPGERERERKKEREREGGRGPYSIDISIYYIHRYVISILSSSIDMIV
jgi:hypothetical protein